jgi:hypothetical protein
MHHKRRGAKKKIASRGSHHRTQKIVAGAPVSGFGQKAFIDTVTGLFSHPIFAKRQPAFRVYDRTTRALIASLLIPKLVLHVTLSCLRIRQIRRRPIQEPRNYVESYGFVFQCIYPSIQLSLKDEHVLPTPSFCM